MRKTKRGPFLWNTISSWVSPGV